MNAGTAIITLALQDTEFYRDLEQVAEETRKKIQGIGVAAIAVGTSISASLALAAKSATQHATEMRSIEVVFKDSTGEAVNLARAINDDVGKSVKKVVSEIASVAQLGTNLGLATNEAAELGAEVSRLGADIDKHFGKSSGDGIAKLKAALGGSNDALKEFGITLSDSAVAAELSAMGINKTIEQATELEKALARESLIMKQANDLQITGAASAGGYLSALGNLSQSFSDLANAVGLAIKPIYDFADQLAGRVVNAISGVVDQITAMVQSTPRAVQIVAGFGAACIAAGVALVGLGSQLVVGIGLWAATTIASRLALSVLQSVPVIGPLVTAALHMINGSLQLLVVGFGLLTAPVVAAIAAVAAVSAGIYYLHKTTGAFQPVLDGLSAAASYCASVFMESVLPALTDVYNLVSGALGKAFSGLGSSIKSAMQMAAPYVKALADVINNVLVAAAETVAGSIAMISEAISEVAKWLMELMGISSKASGNGAAASNDRNSVAGGLAGAHANDPAKVVEPTDELKSFAESLKESLKSPQEKFDEYTAELTKAFNSGLITSEQMAAAADKARKDLQDDKQQEYENSDAGKKQKALEQFGEQLRKETMSLEEQVAEQIAHIQEALATGNTTFEAADRAVKAAQQKLVDQAEKIQKEAAEKIKKERDDQLKEIQGSASREMNIAKARGGEAGKEAEIEAMRKLAEALEKSGFKGEAQDAQVEYLGKVIARSREIGDEFQKQRDNASLLTTSAQEATLGLGNKTYNQQMLEAAIKSANAAAAASIKLDKLDAIHTTLRG